MLVLKRGDFLKLSAGTIYAKGKSWHWNFDQLAIKGDTLSTDDWGVLHPIWIEADDGREAVERLDEMLMNGASYPMAAAAGRDGCFDEDDVFLVLERADLMELRGMIDQALSVSTPETK